MEEKKEVELNEVQRGFINAMSFVAGFGASFLVGGTLNGLIATVPAGKLIKTAMRVSVLGFQFVAGKAIGKATMDLSKQIIAATRDTKKIVDGIAQKFQKQEGPVEANGAVT